MLKAILSTTLMTEGLFHCREVSFDSVNLKGIPSYVNHPGTKTILEQMGAVSTPGLFGGLQVGECYLAVPLADNKREAGWTIDQAIQGLGDLKAKLVVRVA